MKSSCFKSSVKLMVAVLLMHSLCTSYTALARLHPPVSALSSTTSPSSQALRHTNSAWKKPVTTANDPAVVDSLRRIPPSIPNPTQNKLRPERRG